MVALIRTRTGEFFIENSIKLGELEKIIEAGELNKILIPIDEAIGPYNKIVANESALKYLENGNKLSQNYFTNVKPYEICIDEKYLVYDHNKRLIGLYKAIQSEEDILLRPVTMFL